MIYDEKTVPPVLWDECQRLLNKIRLTEDEQAALAEVAYAHGVIRGAELLRALRPSAAAGLYKLFDESFAAQVSALREEI